MPLARIALANVRSPKTPEDSLAIVTEAIVAAADQQAQIVCFPECIIPGYRIGTEIPPVDVGFLKHAWKVVDQTAAERQIGVILGTERPEGDAMLITARVTNADGSLAGFQTRSNSIRAKRERTCRERSGVCFTAAS